MENLLQDTSTSLNAARGLGLNSKLSEETNAAIKAFLSFFSMYTYTKLFAQLFVFVGALVVAWKYRTYVRKLDDTMVDREKFLYDVYFGQKGLVGELSDAFQAISYTLVLFYATPLVKKIAVQLFADVKGRL